MAKKTKDIALDFLRSISAVPIKTMQEARESLYAAVGEDKGKYLLNLLIRRRNSENADYTEYYSELYAADSSLMPAVGAIDGDILRRICHWLEYHKRQLGKSLLDVGCGNGIITCFLAQQMPYARIVGIDCDDNAITAAQALARKIGLQNVEFRAMSLGTLDESFDCVLTSRTLRENLTPGELDPMALLNQQAALYATRMQTFARELCECTKYNGCVVSFEQLERKALYLGWMHAVNNEGLAPVRQCQKELQCVDITAPEGTLQTMMCIKGIPAGEQEIYQSFIDPYREMLKKGSWVLDGFEADVYLQTNHGALLEGYNAYFADGRKATRIAFWEDISDANFFLSEQHLSNGTNKLFRCLMATKPEETQSLHKDVNSFLSQGWTVKELHYVDGAEFESDLPEK